MNKFNRRERFFFYLFLLGGMIAFNVIGFHEPLLPNLVCSAFVLAVVVAALWVESKGWIAIKKHS